MHLIAYTRVDLACAAVFVTAVALPFRKGSLFEGRVTLAYQGHHPVQLVGHPALWVCWSLWVASVENGGDG